MCTPAMNSRLTYFSTRYSRRQAEVPFVPLLSVPNMSAALEDVSRPCPSHRPRHVASGTNKRIPLKQKDISMNASVVSGPGWNY
jgi:hypothetical protein